MIIRDIFFVSCHLRPAVRRSPDRSSFPGSVANLGGGFDTLGVAVQLYLRRAIVDVRDDGGTELVVSQEHAAGDRAERAGAGVRRYSLDGLGVRRRLSSSRSTSDIPMAAGLGSSAAATVAGLRVFERVDRAVPDEVLLERRGRGRGACGQRGAGAVRRLTSVRRARRRRFTALRWAWPDDLRLVVATPAVGSGDGEGAAALPDVMPRKDAIFNLQRVLSLVHALQHGDDERLREAVQDRWHQPARAALVPLLGERTGPGRSRRARRVSVGSRAVGGRAGAAGLRAGRAAAREPCTSAPGVEVTVRTLGGASRSDAMADAGASAHGRTV